LIGEFGFEAMRDWANLEKCGMLRQSSGLLGILGGGKPKFEAIRKEFNLIVEQRGRKTDSEGNDLGPIDLDGPYNEFVPLLVRLVQAGVTGKWEKGSSGEKLMASLGLQFGVYGEKSVRTDVSGERPRRVLLFVLGGVTLSECLLFGNLGKVIFDDTIEFHLGSTSIITSPRLFEEICPCIAGSS
jgi:hypothetical protein